MFALFPMILAKHFLISCAKKGSLIKFELPFFIFTKMTGFCKINRISRRFTLHGKTPIINTLILDKHRYWNSLDFY